jgi:hypothetical protein
LGREISDIEPSFWNVTTVGFQRPSPGKSAASTHPNTLRLLLRDRTGKTTTALRGT